MITVVYLSDMHYYKMLNDLRVHRPAEARLNRVSQGTVDEDLT